MLIRYLIVFHLLKTRYVRLTKFYTNCFNMANKNFLEENFLICHPLCVQYKLLSKCNHTFLGKVNNIGGIFFHL